MIIRFLSKSLLVIFLAFVLVFFQLYLIDQLPSPINRLDLLVPTIIFIFLIAGRYLALVFAFFSAWLLDILSFYFFGLHILSLLAVVALADPWLRNWFTRHSLYSFLFLGGVAVLIKNLLFYGVLFIFSTDSRYLWWRLEFWLDWGREIIAVVLVLAPLFYLALNIDRRLRPSFLNRQPLDKA